MDGNGETPVFHGNDLESCNWNNHKQKVDVSGTRQKSLLFVGKNKQMGVSKNRGTPKMDGENNGKPYEQMDDLGGKPLFLETSKSTKNWSHQSLSSKHP